MSRQVRPTGPLNKTALGEAVAATLGVSIEDGHQAVAAVLDTIARTVAAGHQVAVTNFGTFVPKHVPARKAWNPATGDPILVEAGMRVHFRVSPQLQAAVKAHDPDAAVITKRHRRTPGGAR